MRFVTIGWLGFACIGYLFTACSGGSGGVGGSTSDGGGGTQSGGGADRTGGGGAPSGGSTSSSGGVPGSGATPGMGGTSAAAGATGKGGTGTGGAASSAGGASAGSGGATGSGTGGNAGDSCIPGQLAASGTLAGRFGSVKVLVSNSEYFLQVNEWNATAMQAMTYGGSSIFKILAQQASTPTTGGPTGFPSIFIGANSNHATSGSNLPKQVSALTTVPTTWNWSDNGTLADTTTNSYNATYDVWFSVNPSGDPTAGAPSGGFLMVWYYKPPDAQPIGQLRTAGITIPGASGLWNVWIGTNGGRPCISYVRQQPIMSMGYDLNNFIRDAVTNRPGTLQSSWYLSNIFAGFEIWRGGVNLETTGFCAVVN